MAVIVFGLSDTKGDQVLEPEKVSDFVVKRTLPEFI
jgi:hypothetical protein